MIGAGILLVGIVIGRLLPGETPDAPVTRAADRSSAIPAHSREEPMRAGFTRSKRVGNPPAEEVAGGAGSHNPTDGMVLMPLALINGLGSSAQIKNLDQELFTQDDRMQKALQITDYEKALIQSAWRESRQNAHKLESSSLQAQQIDEWTMHITVPDMSQSLKPLGNVFRPKLDQALGSNRSEAFLAIKQIDGVFSPAAGERSFVVTSEAVGDGHWRYRMTLQSPGDNRVWVGESIPDELQHLMEGFQLAQ